MSSLAAASRPSERIFAVVSSSPRGLLGLRRAPGAAHAEHLPLAPRTGCCKWGLCDSIRLPLQCKAAKPASPRLQ